MRKILVVGMLCMLVSSSVCAYDEPLTPRFTRVVGVGFAALPWPIFSFTCGEGERAVSYKATGGTHELVTYGLVVKGIINDSPAAEAGIHCGDLITAVNGHQVTTVNGMQSIVNESEASVRLTIRVPVPTSVDEKDEVQVHYTAERDVVLKTITYDRVQALRKTLTDELSFNDAFGKPFLVRTASTFVDRQSGMLEYSCSFTHAGEQETVLLESAYFTALGSAELLPKIRRGETKTFSFTASERDGIPTRVEIPVRVDRHLHTEKVHDYIKAKDGAAGRNEEGDRSGDWHTWVSFDPACWVPESVARAIALKRGRGS